MPIGPPPRDAVVVRFRPTDPERVLSSAAKEQRRVGHHGLSTFVVSPGDHDPAWAEARALEASALDNIKPGQKYYVTTVGNLLDEGFVFMKDEDETSQDPRELEEHYCVSLGDDPDLDDVKRFLQVFSERKPT